MSDERNGLDQAGYSFHHILYIVLDAVLLEVLRPVAAAMATKVDGCARNAKLQEREHERVPDDGLTTRSVDKKHRRRVASHAHFEHETGLRADRFDVDLRARHNESLTRRSMASAETAVTPAAGEKDTRITAWLSWFERQLTAAFINR